MQRRAAAALFVFFLVLGASAYSVIAVADAPPVELQGEVTANEESSFTLDGQQYSVSAIEMQEASGGGHGGGGGAHLAGVLTYNVADAPQEESFESGDDVEYRGGTYVATMNNSTSGDGKDLVLTEQFDVETRLQNDDAVYNSTVESEGQEFVRYRENNTIVPLSEYLPAPRVDRFSEGDTLPYQNNTATVSTVGNESATIEWRAPEEFERDLEEGANITLANDETYLVHFPNDGEVVLSQNFQQYQAEQHEQDVFHERINGLWAAAIIAVLAAILVLGLAYMPVRG